MKVQWRNGFRIPLVVLAAGSIGCGSESDSGQPTIDRLTRRDLTSYFAKRAGTTIRLELDHLGVTIRIKADYPRAGPTVTGTSDSKYYLWVVSRDASGARVLAEGATRVAVVDSSVEVTHFFPKEYIRSHPASVDSVFPKSVVAEIRKRL